MSTTQTVIGSDSIRSYPDSPGAFARVFEVAVQIKGTYLTGSKPTFNFFSALQASHFGLKTFVGIKANIVRDRYDGTNRYTAQVALSNSISGQTNDLATLTIQSGATDGGSGGSEVSDGTDVSGVYTFLVVCEIVAE